MGGKWPYSCCFERCCFQDLFKQLLVSLCSFHPNFSPVVQVVQSYSSTDKATAWKNSCFILSERLDFHLVNNNLSIAIHTLHIHMLTSLSVDEMLLPRHGNSLLISEACHLRRWHSTVTGGDSDCRVSYSIEIGKN